MHCNTVKRGLAASPEQWRWSSYRFYSLNEPGIVASMKDGRRFRSQIARHEKLDKALVVPALRKTREERGTPHLGGPPARRYEFVVLGYVVMPEHFHLLITEPERANPSVVIQALKLGAAKRLIPTSPKDREK